jgi:hypothetical protein
MFRFSHFLRFFSRAALVIPLTGISLPAQASREEQVPPQDGPERAGADIQLRRISLFSSGVGFFEHAGTIDGSARISLPFNAAEMNDALKSLIINDPASSPTVSYQSEETLSRTLKSLAVDLLGNPGVPELLNSLKGAEIEALVPHPVSGRIVFVEARTGGITRERERETEVYLSLYTAAEGVRILSLKEIRGFSFKDPRMNADFNRALDLIARSRDSDTRLLTVELGGKSRRKVSLSYVIPAPVWKAAYRLDLSQAQPLLQGWAIVDNTSDADWEQVELSLVTGRPVSFIQNLYPPYHVSRPVVPLAIAGAAEPRSYESGSAGGGRNGVMMMAKEYRMDETDDARPSYEAAAPSYEAAPMPRASAAVSGGAETALGRPAGDYFEFTIKKPVTLARRESAMLPLVESPVPAERVLVFSGARAAQGRPSNPAIAAELTNATGMKLPAGPVTVYDNGVYAGDALVEFFPIDEKRLVSYGEDLSVTGSIGSSATRSIVSVTIQKGIMTINRKQVHERTYTFRNAGGKEKRLVIEHPITAGTTLAAPDSYAEKTASLYRFAMVLPYNGVGGADLVFTVREERPLSETAVLSQLAANTFIGYSTNQEIPAAVREALRAAVALKENVEKAKRALATLEGRWNHLIAEQERIRQNLEAVGNQSDQGQRYLTRLSEQDAEIDGLYKTIVEAREAVQSAQREYEAYIGGLALN